MTRTRVHWSKLTRGDMAKALYQRRPVHAKVKSADKCVLGCDQYILPGDAAHWSGASHGFGAHRACVLREFARATAAEGKNALDVLAEKSEESIEASAPIEIKDEGHRPVADLRKLKIGDFKPRVTARAESSRPDKVTLDIENIHIEITFKE